MTDDSNNNQSKKVSTALKNRKEFEEKISNDVEEKLKKFSANLTSEVTEKLNETQNKFHESLSDVKDLLKDIKKDKMEKKDTKVAVERQDKKSFDGASTSRSKNSYYGGKPNQKKGSEPKDNLNPETFERKTDESRIEWINRLFSEIGFEGQAFNNIINNVTTLVQKDLDNQGLRTIKLNVGNGKLPRLRPCQYYQSGKCRQLCYDSCHLDKHVTKNNRAYVHCCKICMVFLHAGLEHPMESCIFLMEIDNIELDKNYVPTMVYQPTYDE